MTPEVLHRVLAALRPYAAVPRSSADLARLGGRTWRAVRLLVPGEAVMTTRTTIEEEAAITRPRPAGSPVGRLGAAQGARTMKLGKRGWPSMRHIDNVCHALNMGTGLRYGPGQIDERAVRFPADRADAERLRQEARAHMEAACELWNGRYWQAFCDRARAARAPLARLAALLRGECATWVRRALRRVSRPLPDEGEDDL